MKRELKKRTIGRFLLPILILAAAISWWALPQSSAATYNVTIDPGTTYQTLEGFGAAIAWYGSWLTDHPNKAELYKILFQDLGLDIIRFRNTYGSRNGESFAPIEAAVLAGAKNALGHDLKVLISSWTPPSDLKLNGTLNGGTLAKINGSFPYDDFAQYWYDSLVAYKEKGIVPDYISIQNEPDYENSGWETCIFKPAETTDYPGYGTALDAVYNKLQILENVPKIIGPEACGLNESLGQYTDNMDLSQVYGIAHHLYNGGSSDNSDPDAFITNMCKYKSLYGDKPLFQTEFDYGTPLNTGILMINALVEEGVSGYFYWDLIWSNSQRPLVKLENAYNTSEWTTTEGYIITDWYYVFEQFSKFTDPGFTRVAATSDSSTIRTTAFVSEDQEQLTVILINNGSTESTVALDLGGYTAGSSAIYRTIPDGAEKCSEIGSLGAGNTVSLPAQSIATVVISTGGATPTATATATTTATATATPTVTATPTASAAVYTLNYTQFDWGSGATVSITIKNNSATAIDGWQLTWDFGGTQKISNLWNGSYTQDGNSVTVTNLDYNATIPAGGTVSFGFNMSYSGANTKPTAFALNGTVCQVQ
jgi:glucuronoarabinoxylan endo-1,4-beta-xylanase